MWMCCRQGVKTARWSLQNVVLTCTAPLPHSFYRLQFPVLWNRIGDKYGLFWWMSWLFYQLTNKVIRWFHSLRPSVLWIKHSQRSLFCIILVRITIISSYSNTINHQNNPVYKQYLRVLYCTWCLKFSMLLSLTSDQFENLRRDL